MSGIKSVRSKQSFMSEKSQGFCFENGKIDILERKKTPLRNSQGN